MEFRLYVVNATEYGKGNEVGTWLELPMTCNALDATLEKIGVSATDNYIIMDAEVSLPFIYKIDEYANIEYLNSLVAKLTEINSQGDLGWLAAYMDETGYSVEYAIDNYEKHSYYDGDIIEVY